MSIHALVFEKIPKTAPRVYLECKGYINDFRFEGDPRKVYNISTLLGFDGDD